MCVCTCVCHSLLFPCESLCTLTTHRSHLCSLASCRFYNPVSSQTRCVYISTTLPLSPPYHPGDRHIAKWSQSSCTTEATAGTATTALPAPAVTRSCWMEPASSWTSTLPKMTTCWMGMLPPQVGSMGFQVSPRSSLVLLSIPVIKTQAGQTLTVQSDSLNFSSVVLHLEIQNQV